MTYKESLEGARGTYRSGLRNVESDPEPRGQKFPIGSRVYIQQDLGPCMSHFTSGCSATVKYTYAHAYGGEDILSYCLDVDGHGEISWYKEHQLTLLEGEL